ncbi:insulinase family protein [Patescibacteria group bacterium]|nr:insulinase family protein [Patescibacteria group bacterium]
MFQLKDFGVTKNTGVLKNGSKVFHFYKPNMPVSTAVIFDSGSKFDPVGKEGLAHFVEHILFKSTKKFKDETEAGLFLESIGGQANAFTGVDLLGVTADIGIELDYPKVVDFIHELTKESLFEEQKIEIERGTILGEIADYESNPALHIRDLMQDGLFQGTYAERPIAGNAETVMGISRDDLYNFYKSRIAAKNMSVVVAGDIEFDKIVDLFDATFSEALPFEEKSDAGDLEVIRKDPLGIKVYEGIDHIFTGFSFRTGRYTNPDSKVLDVIETLMGEGFSSSLFRKLRTENGLVYSLKVMSGSYIDRGHFSVVTATSKEKLQLVLDILTSEFKRLESGDVDEVELNLAKQKIIRSKIREMQDSNTWVGFHLSDIFFNPDNPIDLAGYLNEIENITLKDVVEISKKYFTKNSWYLALCGDVKENDFKIDY